MPQRKRTKRLTVGLPAVIAQLTRPSFSLLISATIGVIGGGVAWLGATSDDSGAVPSPLDNEAFAEAAETTEFGSS